MSTLAPELPELTLSVQTVFGNGVQIKGHQFVKARTDYYVVIVELESRDNNQIVIKLAGPEATIACPFERNAAIHRMVSENTEIPMPEIYAVDVTYNHWPWRYIIKQYVPGVEWSELRHQLDTRARARAMAEFGGMVAELHEINFESFGELSADGGLLDEQCLLEALAQRARVIIKDATYLEFFLQVLEANSSRFTDVHLASLCHEDLHPFNILYKPADHGWQIATILDFDKAWAGHAESDLARLDLWRGIAGPAFWEAYSVVRGVDEKYDIRRPVYQLLWCLEFADPSDQHAADTARVCRQLGIRLPKPFR